MPPKQNRPKRNSPMRVTVYCTEEQKAKIEKVAKDSGSNRQDWALQTLMARADGGMALAPELAARVRAEAKRLKVPAEHVLSSWILAHNTGKDGD